MAEKARGAVDLDSMSAQELNTLIKSAEAKLQEKQTEAKAALVEEFRNRAAELGLPLEALVPGSAAAASGGRRQRKDAGGTVPPKYRGPGGAEWSGRGRMPKWLSAMEAQGRNRDEFRV
ncbi:H-NS family nucleoid-associated regulatory protein [Muricoccus radiodurans]|uniref:H-NS histone family protein n=1 Tax=Muricoccus radiodurans TaxID=2231721 RepID=UPI003CEEADBE